MKKINKGQFRFILFLSLFLTLSFSCQRVMDYGEEDDVSSSDGTALKIMARSGGNTSIEYPVYLYAFNEKGDCAAKQKITSEEVEMNLQLPSGNFKVVALSGVSKGYVMSDNPKISDVITMQEGGCASKAMMMGMADVSLEGKNKTVNLLLTYMVASLNVVLTKADKVKQVKVGISPLHSSLNFEGKYGGEEKKLEIECALGTDGRWTAGPVYIFPGSGSQTTLSITLDDSKGSHTYGYVSKVVPQANHPYNIGGSYTGDISIDGSLIAKGWEDAIDVEFKFETDEDNSNDEDGDEDISGVPEVGSIWNDCIVAASNKSSDGSGTDLLLMSLEEWESQIATARSVPEGYSVHNIKNWRFPTEQEAKAIRDRFNGDRLIDLNEKIEARNQEELEITHDSDTRYLCDKEGVFYSFQFIGAKRVTKAGKDKFYLIRVVTTHHFSK